MLHSESETGTQLGQIVGQSLISTTMGANFDEKGFSEKFDNNFSFFREKFEKWPLKYLPRKNKEKRSSYFG